MKLENDKRSIQNIHRLVLVKNQDYAGNETVQKMFRGTNKAQHFLHSVFRIKKLDTNTEKSFYEHLQHPEKLTVSHTASLTEYFFFLLFLFFLFKDCKLDGWVSTLVL